MRASPKTPVELNDNIYYKRDDYFQPFGDYHVNGGKVRQALIMFEKYIDQIKTCLLYTSPSPRDKRQ